MALWQGRFSEKMDAEAWRFNASLDFDRRLAEQDIRGSIAWANALETTGAVSRAERDELRRGLAAIQSEFQTGKFRFEETDEDIHTAVERRLHEIIGPTAGKLHTGRSRNDQVATDLRLWLLDHTPNLASGLTSLQSRLLARAEREIDVLVPGYTHLQRAQPVLLSHWWLAHFWPLERDKRRLSDVQAHARVLPLGAAALAGTPLAVDRAALAGELGFDLPAPNSLDAVSDRDFAADFLYFAALCAVHLSRFAEQLMLFGTQEFGFVVFSDRHATGSSLMPQKKNPDLLELVRASSSDLIGRLTGLLSLLKALPSAYDKDLQRDKQPVFFAYDTLLASLDIVGKVVADLEINPDRMKAAISDEMMATDLADHLVATGMPFRQAHQVVAAIVEQVAAGGLSFRQAAAREFAGIESLGSASIEELLEPQQSIARRSVIGGTAAPSVRQQIKQARSLLQASPDHPLYSSQGAKK